MAVSTLCLGKVWAVLFWHFTLELPQLKENSRNERKIKRRDLGQAPKERGERARGRDLRRL